MAASDKTLGLLHAQLARVLTEMLEPRSINHYDNDDDPTEVTSVHLDYPPANVLAVAAKFLKDNNITASIESDPALAGLAHKLRDRGRVSDEDVKEALKASGNALLQ